MDGALCVLKHSIENVSAQQIWRELLQAHRKFRIRKNYGIKTRTQKTRN